MSLPGRRGVRDVSPPVPEWGVQVSISPEPRKNPRLLCQEQSSAISAGAKPSELPQLLQGLLWFICFIPSGVLETPPHHQPVQSPVLSSLAAPSSPSQGLHSPFPVPDKEPEPPQGTEGICVERDTNPECAVFLIAPAAGRCHQSFLAGI